MAHSDAQQAKGTVVNTKLRELNSCAANLAVKILALEAERDAATSPAKGQLTKRIKTKEKERNAVLA